MSRMAGQGGVGGCTSMTQTTWLCLGLALEKPWLMLDWAVSLLLCTIELREQTSHLTFPPFLALKVFQSLGRQLFAVQTLTIDNLLTSWCGQSHKSAEDSFKGTCVKFDVQE